MELDPITADFPSRTAREEDEEAAEALGPAPEPVAIWTPEARAASVDGRFKSRLMIVATTPESCALLRSAAAAAAAAAGAGAAGTSGSLSLLGAFMLPGLSVANNTLFSLSRSSSSPSPSSLPAPTDRVCAVYSVASAETDNINNANANNIVLVLCQFFDSVPEERAFGLAAALSAKIDATSTLVLGSLPSHAIPGASGAEIGAPPLYRLQTGQALSWAKGLQKENSTAATIISALPPGAVASGFPAAVVSRAAAEGKSAVLLARADARAGAPAAEALRSLAIGAAAAVESAAASSSPSSSSSSSSSFASFLRSAGAKAAAGAAAATAAAADAASARAAVYA